MTKRAGKGVLEGWYSRITLDDILAMVGKDADLISRVKKRIAEAHKASNERVFQKITASVRALPRIVNEPPLLYHVDKSVINECVVGAFFKRYRETLEEERRMLVDRFKVVDVAVKAHAADQNRHLGGSQRQQLGPIHQQLLRRSLLSVAEVV
jgi:hypothetical protein